MDWLDTVASKDVEQSTQGRQGSCSRNEGVTGLCAVEMNEAKACLKGVQVCCDGHEGVRAAPKRLHPASRH